MEPSRHESSEAAADRPLRSEMQISFEELARMTGLTSIRLARLVRLGLVEPVTPGATAYSAEEALRLKRMLRLHADLGVSLFSAAIIADLLERLDRLERPR